MIWPNENLYPSPTLYPGMGQGVFREGRNPLAARVVQTPPSGAVVFERLSRLVVPEDGVLTVSNAPSRQSAAVELQDYP